MTVVVVVEAVTVVVVDTVVVVVDVVTVVVVAGPRVLRPGGGNLCREVGCR